MKLTRQLHTLLLTLFLVLTSTLSTSAQVGSLPATITGGPNGDADWTIIANGGITGNYPGPGTECFPSVGKDVINTGIMVATAELNSQRDAYDQAGIWINDRVFTSTTVVVGAANIAAGPMVVSGMNVWLDYTALSDSPTLRTLVSVENLTGVARPITVTLAVNFGSDQTTHYISTSSGDALFTGGDRWAVSADGTTVVTDVVNTTALYGLSSPPAIPSFVSDQVFACPGGGDIQGILAEFTLTIPASSTRRLMFFQQINATISNALAGAGPFNAPTRPTNPLAVGLTSQQLAEIQNWRDFFPVYLPVIRR